MGFGAVKFSVLLGLYLGYVGWLNVLIGGWLSFALGGLLGVVMLRGGHANRNTVVQFGPMMFFGALVAIVLV
jgi:leader peptidase (prepilin peptidase)/N-methyltransferase